jgi:transposase
MLSDFTGAEHIYIACGYTDLRKSIDGLAMTVQKNFELDPFSNSLFLFCGKTERPDQGTVLGRRWIRTVVQASGTRPVPVASQQRTSASDQLTAVPVADGRPVG